MTITTASTGLSTAHTQAALAAGKAVADSGLSAADITKSIGVSVVPTASTKMLRKLAVDTGDVAVLIVGDSTGNESNEWVYLYAQWLASNHPAYTVDYYLWNDGNDTYDAAVELQAGTGSNTLRIYNASVSGSSPEYLMGAKFAPAIKIIPQCDLVLINHGHNMFAAVGDEKTEYQRVPRFLGPISQILRVHSGAGLIMVAQNPNRDTSAQEVIANAVFSVAGILNGDVADGHTPFIAAGKDPSLYNDDKHPSNTGQQLLFNAVTDTHKLAATPKAAISPFDIAQINLLPEGDYLDFESGFPDGWGGSGTITKDTTTYISGKGFSTKLSGNSSHFTYTAPGALLRQLRGSWVTLAVRMFVEDGQPSSSGRIAINSNVDSANTSVATGAGQGGWRWNVMSFFVTEAVTYLQIRMFGDSSSNGGAAFFDKAVLVNGRLPADSQDNEIIRTMQATIDSMLDRLDALESA